MVLNSPAAEQVCVWSCILPLSVNKVDLYTEHILSVYDQHLSEDVETVITLAGDFNDFDVKLITEATALDSLYHGKTHKNSQLDFIFTTHPAYYKSTYTFDVSFYQPTTRV